MESFFSVFTVIVLFAVAWAAGSALDWALCRLAYGKGAGAGKLSGARREPRLQTAQSSVLKR